MRSALVADTHKLIEQDGTLLFRLQLVGLVLANLVLHEAAHLGKLRLALRLETLDKIGHLNVLLLRDAKLFTQFGPHLFSALLVTLDHIKLGLDILEGHGNFIC